jgi:hypothetical protein
MTYLRTFALALAGAVALAIPGGTAIGESNPSFEPEFSTEIFEDPMENPWFPLVPGTTFFYEAETDEGLETSEFTITHDTIVIIGVTCKVIQDLEFVNGELTEETLDYFAEDEDGNVWYFGEDTTSFHDGVPSPAGTWRAGVDGAMPGILLPGDPKTGMSYRQERAPGIAEDMGKVLKIGVEVEIGIGEFEGCLVTKEWNPLASGGSTEQKTYAPGVGLILVRELSGQTVRVELVDVDD